MYDVDTADARQISVLEDASARVRAADDSLDALDVTFNATWMLLVTWSNVPAFKAEFTGSNVRKQHCLYGWMWFN